MNQWPTVTVADCAADEPYSTQIGPFGDMIRADTYVDHGVPVLRGVNVNGSGRFFDHGYVFVSKTHATERFAKFTCRSGDVVLCHKGTLGKIGIIPANARYDSYIMGNSMMRVRCNESRILPDYLYYWLRSDEAQQYLLSRVSQVGVPQIQRPLSTLREATFALPPMTTQRAIVGMLGALDDKIELNRQMNETLEAMARALFKSWFVDFDPVRAKMEGRAPFGMDAATAALFPDTMRGDVPHGWLPSTLGDVTANADGDIQTGPFGSQLHAKDYVEHGLPVIMPTNIRGRRVAAEDIVRVTSEDAQRLSRHQLEVGDLVYSRRGDVEKHAIIGPEERGWLCGTGCLRVRPRRTHTMGPSPHYLSLWLDQPTSRAWIVARAVGATMPNLNTTILGELPVLLPPQPVIDAFDARIAPLDDRARLARAESITLAQLRDLLLPKLLSGELRIRDAERTVEAVL